MRCGICFRHFDPDQQTAACPHEILDAPIPRPGGIKLRPEFQNQIDEAFALRDKEQLQNLACNSLNYAVRYYARHKLQQLEELEKDGYV